MVSLLESYDSALLGILQNEGKIQEFLGVIFGFLYRKTDFYRILLDKSENLGFPPGVAEKIVYSSFKKFKDLADKDAVEREELIRKKTNEIRENSIKNTPPPVIREETVIDDSDINAKITTIDEGSTMQDKGITKTKLTTENSEITKNKDIENSEENNEKTTSDNENNTDKSLENPEIKKQDEYQSKADSYNGAIRENYSWSQSINELDLRVFIPKDVKKGKDIKVDVKKKFVKVTLKKQDGEKVLVEGEFKWEIRAEDCVWTLVPGEHVHISLEKIQERWWDAALVGEKEISVKHIDASRPMTDLDEEAQAKVEEMMYNEHLKRLGKPQIHEQKMHDILKNAWDVEGSPFKGQPYDPSLVDISGSQPNM